MKNKVFSLQKIGLCFLLLLFFQACSLKITPTPNSGFLSNYSNLKIDEEGVFFRQSFFKEKDILLKMKEEKKEEKFSVYIAGVDLSHLKKGEKSKLPEEVYEDLAKFFKETLVEKFKENKNVILVNEPKKNSLIIELSLSEAKKTSALINALKMISGLKFLGIISFIKNGSIAIEGRIVDFNTKETLVSFLDRRKDKTVWIFSFKEYTWFGLAKENIENWCEEIVKLFQDDTLKENQEKTDNKK